jgi:adenylate cyclase
MSGERRLAAIMFTDIEGFTRSAQANEALTLQLLEEHRSLLRPVFSSYGGTEVKTMGDAFLVEFRSALDAVLCAAELQKRLAERNTRVSDRERLKVRVGIHMGDVVHGAGDVYGDAVNVASRIEPLAKGGGICVSEQVYESVRNKTELEFEALGEVELKNVQFALRVYRILLPLDGPPKTESAAPRERLAVLPFVNISPDPNDEYFADGLTEEMITKLSQVSDLKVIARTSAMNYKKKEKKISDIGRELNVGSIIEGSVRKVGNRIRVTVQLVDARTEEHLWASNYDKDLDDVFAIQSDIASRVAASVTAGAFFNAPSKETESVEAYTLYIKALQDYHEGSESSLRKAVSLLDQALSLDPNFARASAALALAWARLAVGGYEDFTVVTAKAEPAAKKALALDPNSAEAHAAMALIDGDLDRFEASVDHARTAIRLNPNLAEAYFSLAINSGTVSRFEDAISNSRKAYELDPLNENTGLYLAFFLNSSGHAAESLPILQRMHSISPSSPRIHNRFAETYMFLGDFAKAQEWLASGLGINPREPLLRVNQGLLYAFTGKKEEAEASLRELQSDKVDGVRLYGKLFINAALGNIDAAFEALDRQAEMHAWPALVKSLPVFAELRKDPRFSDFCRKVGLPPE